MRHVPLVPVVEIVKTGSPKPIVLQEYVCTTKQPEIMHFFFVLSISLVASEESLLMAASLSFWWSSAPPPFLAPSRKCSEDFFRSPSAGGWRSGLRLPELGEFTVNVGGMLTGVGMKFNDVYK